MVTVCECYIPLPNVTIICKSEISINMTLKNFGGEFEWISIIFYSKKMAGFSNKFKMFGAPGVGADMTQQWQMPPHAQMQPQDQIEPPAMEETDNSHRPPNAFILYSQAMRTQARQDNPSLSNTEVSSLLGKMWKEVPAEIKLQYKQKAAAMQEQFKREHPDYTYRKARRKRALNELLTKSTAGPYGQFPIGAGFPGMPMPGQDMSQFQMGGQQAFPMGFPGMMQQMQMPSMPSMPGASQSGQDQSQQNPMFQIPGMGAQSQGMPNFSGMGGMAGFPQK